MRQGIDMGDGLPVKHHADKLGSSPTHATALRGIGVAPFAAIHHIALDLVGDVGRNLGGDGTRTAHRRPVVNQRGTCWRFSGVIKFRQPA